jgi:hypothetical protein
VRERSGEGERREKQEEEEGEGEVVEQEGRWEKEMARRYTERNRTPT